MAGPIVSYQHHFVAITQAQINTWDPPPPHTRLPHLQGRCPVCGDHFTYQVKDTIVTGGQLAAAPTAPPPPTLTRLIECNCQGTEGGRPQGVTRGCGSSWLVRLVQQANGSYLVTPETDLSLLPAATLFEQDSATEQTRIQQTAERWLAGITATVGLFGLTGVVTAKDAVSGMAWWGRLIVALIIVSAMVTALAALLSGYQAAYGWPKPQLINSPEKLREFYRKRLENPQQAAAKLRTAVFLAVTALILLLVAMLLLWFLPRDPAGPTRVLLINQP